MLRTAPCSVPQRAGQEGRGSHLSCRVLLVPSRSVKLLFSSSCRWCGLVLLSRAGSSCSVAAPESGVECGALGQRLLSPVAASLLSPFNSVLSV